MSAADKGDELLDGLLELLAGSSESPGAHSLQASGVSVQASLRPPGKKKTYERKTDPNRVRNQRNAEIRGLKREIGDLGSLVRELQMEDRSKRRLLEAAPQTRSNAAAGREELVWEEVCRDQQRQRVRAERENLRLRSAVDDYRKRAVALRRSLVRSVEAMRSSSMLHARFTNRVYGLPIDLEADGALYNELAAEISELRGEAEKMFELNGLGAPSLEPCSGSNIHHFGKERSLDMFLRGFLPYDLDAADDVIWQIYRGSGKHRGPLYFKSSKAPSEDTVLEKFALELFTEHTRADFRYRQVVRRFKEGDRVVIVWIEVVEPLELANKSFTRCGFRAKGYMVCEPMNFPGMPAYTHFRRCQRFTPYLTDIANGTELGEAKQDFSALINFIVSLDTANVHFQQFQDELLHRSLSIRQ